MSNHMPSKVWDGIIYPFPNFNGGTVEVWEWISNFIPHFIMDVIITSQTEQFENMRHMYCLGILKTGKIKLPHNLILLYNI